MRFMFNHTCTWKVMNDCIHCKNDVSGDESCWSCLRVLERSVNDSQSLEATRIENATAKFEWTLADSIQVNRKSSARQWKYDWPSMYLPGICTKFGKDHGVDGVVGYRICLTHRRSSVRAWVDSLFAFIFGHDCQKSWSQHINDV